MAVESTAQGTVETKKDIKGESELVRVWLDAISISGNEEENWRKCADKTVELYRQSTSDPNTQDKKKFNILHSNHETTKPALYNSTPVPDVRRRFADKDPVAKQVCDILERCISYSIDSYDFDHTMKMAVGDFDLPGRAVTRVRYLPYVGKGDTLDYQEVRCEHVPWKHFRRGPGATWPEVPWIAFELFLTRDELTKLSPEYGGQVGLDCQINGIQDKGDGRNVPEIFKRARVWEIWDRDERKVLFIAESFKERPIRTEEDPLKLTDFYPIPRPAYAIETSDSLIPVVPYELYKEQAEELERVTVRIQVLTEALKAKSLHDSRITELERLSEEDDGKSVPVENVGVFSDGSKLADHVMFWPIEVIAATLEKLFLAREQIKQTIYEITGISDILRGETDPNETLGAQQIKTQWGSLRIQNKQAEVQRYARDLFRIKAEIFATKFEPQVLQMMTGIQITPEVAQLLKTDALRGFRVDVESDSTIRADMTRNQQTMNLFLQGVAQYAQAMGPIVMAQPQLMPAAMEVFTAFARNFKLGKQAEDALDAVADAAKQQAAQPKPPDPEEKRIEMEQQAKANELEFKQAESQQKLQFEAAKHRQGMEFERQKHESEMQMRGQEMQMNQAQHQNEMVMRDREMQVNTALTQQKQEADTQVKREQIAAGKEPKTTVKFDANKALSEVAPAMKKHMDESSQLLADATRALAQAAAALGQVAEVVSAPNEIVRDPKTQRAVGTRKVLQKQPRMQ